MEDTLVVVDVVIFLKLALSAMLLLLIRSVVLGTDPDRVLDLEEAVGMYSLLVSRSLLAAGLAAVEGVAVAVVGVDAATFLVVVLGTGSWKLPWCLGGLGEEEGERSTSWSAIYEGILRREVLVVVVLLAVGELS